MHVFAVGKLNRKEIFIMNKIRDTNTKANHKIQITAESMGIMDHDFPDMVVFGMRFQDTLVVSSLNAEQLSLFINDLLTELTRINGGK
jgi:diketogulonate reductase-like aldo/keto reductase